MASPQCFRHFVDYCFLRPAELKIWAPAAARPARVSALNQSVASVKPRASPKHQSLSSSTSKPYSPNLPEEVARETHKFFDQVIVSVRAGDGGDGAVLKVPRPYAIGKAPGKAGAAQEKKLKEKRKKASAGKFKRDADGAVLLPMGGDGGDVVVYAEESVSTLLHFHGAKRISAKQGGNVNAVAGLPRLASDGVSATPVRIPVPVGTVVKRKRGGKLLADLSHPGDEVVVARGGRGGISVLEVPGRDKSHLRPVNAPLGATIMTSPSDKVLTKGLSGEEVSLELTLRIVADVGLVGLPNAGKSSLLAAVTASRPEVADYPFTTLIPNLGCIAGDPRGADGGFDNGPTLADLPGLIKDAHLGRGLGRMFLRHLRRTHLLLHLVDSSAPNPVEDYRILREELRLYNPEYTSRPHIVVLNKMDLLADDEERLPKLMAEINSVAHGMGGALREEEGSEGGRVGAARRLREEEEEDEADSRESSWVLDEVMRDGGEGMLAMLEVREGRAGGGTRKSRPREESEDERFENIPPLAIVCISAKEHTGLDDLLTAIRKGLKEKKMWNKKQGSRKSERGPRLERLKSPQWEL